MKQPILALTALALAVNAQAGGFENARLDTAFMYDEGHSVSFASARKDFDVKGDTFATTTSAVGDRNATTISAKYQLNEKLSLGLTSYDSGAIHVNFQGSGWQNTARNAGTAPLVDAFGPKVNLTSDSIALMARYLLTDNFSATAGLRYDKFNAQEADLFRNAIFNVTYAGAVGTVGPVAAQTLASQAAANATLPTVSSATDISPVFALAYERPDVALRVELLFQASSSVAMNSTCGMGTGFCGTRDKTTGGMPDYLTLNFQTGVAEDTLLYGSVHHGKWSKSQLSVPDTELAALRQNGPTSSFNDSTEYSIGLGRRLNDAISVSASYNWEPKENSTTTSLFTFANGYQGITLGARYTLENMEFSLGYNYTKLNDVLYDGTSDNLYSDNTVSTVGGRVKLKF